MWEGKAACKIAGDSDNIFATRLGNAIAKGRQCDCQGLAMRLPRTLAIFYTQLLLSGKVMRGGRWLRANLRPAERLPDSNVFYWEWLITVTAYYCYRLLMVKRSTCLPSVSTATTSMRLPSAVILSTAALELTMIGKGVSAVALW